MIIFVRKNITISMSFLTTKTNLSVNFKQKCAKKTLTTQIVLFNAEIFLQTIPRKNMKRIGNSKQKFC